ncbi:MAG: hypothetical protein LAN64_19860 [Acidobacteriia bacterium]|nr:hypothetical protein [Terriglobia bacterium]
MEGKDSLDTHHKALSINLEASVFGSFAEIGAGQEVARWFLQVGGASATVAKTISAYDKEVSDEIYGSGSRYVSVERLRAMLEKEWTQLLLQIQLTRGEKTRFFSFVDTVAARNYAGTNLPHGWIGLRFQDQPGAPPNDVILHVNLLDSTSIQEQEALGIIGVNLLYAAFHERSDPETLLSGIAHLVAPDRMEIDYVEVRGPVFDNDSSGKWSAWNLHVLLVTNRFSEAVICSRERGFVPFIEALHKKAVVLAPGVFDSPSTPHGQMMATALRNLGQEHEQSGEDFVGLFCLTIPPSVNGGSDHEISRMLVKMQALYDLGYGILLVQAREIYKMSAIIQRFTSLPIRFVVGISVLLRVFEDDYRHLGGSTLKAVSLLFSQNVRIYAYPMAASTVRERIKKLNATGWEWADVRGTVLADSLKPPRPLRYLYEYLLASHFIVPIGLTTTEMSRVA